MPLTSDAHARYVPAGSGCQEVTVGDEGTGFPWANVAHLQMGKKLTTSSQHEFIRGHQGEQRGVTSIMPLPTGFTVP